MIAWVSGASVRAFISVSVLTWMLTLTEGFHFCVLNWMMALSIPNLQPFPGLKNHTTQSSAGLGDTPEPNTLGPGCLVVCLI